MWIACHFRSGIRNGRSFPRDDFLSDFTRWQVWQVWMWLSTNSFMSSKTYRLWRIWRVLRLPQCPAVMASWQLVTTSSRLVLGTKIRSLSHHIQWWNEVLVRCWFGIHGAYPAIGRSSVSYCCFQPSLGSTGTNGLMSPLGRERESAAVLVVHGMCAFFTP